MKCEGLFFNYGSKEILNGIGFSVQPGEIIAIVGDNGCGKTTLLKALGQFIRIKSGMIDYENEDRDTFDYAGILETPHFWPQLSGRENLQYYLRDKYNDERAFKLIKRFDMGTAAGMKVKHYSLGMQQKLAVILSIMTDSSILLYDEPTNSLDQDSVEVFFELIKEAAACGRTVIMVTHVLSELEKYCDRILLFKNQQLVRLEDELAHENRVLYEISFDSDTDVTEASGLLDEKQIEKVLEHGILIRLDGESISDIVRKLCSYNIVGVSQKKKTLKTLYKEEMQR